MATITTWANCYLNKPVKVQYLKGNLFTADNNAHKLGVKVYNVDGSPVTLSGTATASIVRTDGVTVSVNGTISSNQCTVTIPAEAYALPGTVIVSMRITSSSVTTTLVVFACDIYESVVGSIVDPGTIIPSVESLIAEIERTVATIPQDYTAMGEEVSENKDSATSIKAVISGTEYNVFSPLPYVINSSGIWTSTVNGYHACLPVKGGDTVRLIGGAVSGVYAFLISDNSEASTTADISHVTGYTSRFVLNAFTDTGDITVPSDAKLLYFNVQNNENTSQRPHAIYINGVDYSKSIRTITSKNTESIKKCRYDVNYNRRTGDLWGLRGIMPGSFAPIDLSSISHLNGVDIQLCSDGYTFAHNADLTRNKNVSSGHRLVSTTSQLQSAITSASSGDTITLLPGVYGPVTIKKSLNLIGEDGVIMTNGDLGTFIETATSGIYKTDADVPFTPDVVLDATMLDKGVLLPLTLKTSVQGVVDTKGSYIISGGKLYVHGFTGDVPTNKTIIAIRDDEPIIAFAGASVGANCKLYLENITMIGGSNNINAADASSYTDQKIFAIDCRFLYALTSNALYLRGVKGYFQRCEAAFAYLDGFNYHKNSSTNTLPYGLEIDCIGHDNGHRDSSSSPTDNGSTIHDGGKIVRINGIYYNNNGGNVADASSATVSYNYGCVAFDSKAPYDNENMTSSDFWASLATMYLYGCRAFGSSQNNLYCYNGAIHEEKTEYTTKSGNVIDD